MIAALILGVVILGVAMGCVAGMAVMVADQTIDLTCDCGYRQAHVVCISDQDAVLKSAILTQECPRCRVAALNVTELSSASELNRVRKEAVLPRHHKASLT